MAVVEIAPGGALHALQSDPPTASPESPLVAIAGRWVQPYSATGCVHVLGGLSADFPPPRSSHEDWQGFFDGSLGLPWAIVAIGVISAIAHPLVQHCCHPKWRSRYDGAPWRSLTVVAVATLVCWLVTVVLGFRAHRVSFSAATTILQRAADDVVLVSKLAEGLNVSCAEVVQDLSRLHAACPLEVRDMLSSSVDNIIQQVSGYVQDMRGVNATLAGIAESIAAIDEITAEVGATVGACLAVPAVLVVLCCGAIATTVAIVDKANAHCAERCHRCELPCLGAFCVAPAMLLVSAVAAAELAVGIFSGGFCLEVDETVLRYAEASLGPESDGYALSKYYLAGDGPNPALRRLSKAQVEIFDAVQWVRHYGDVTATSCPQWGREANTILSLETVQYSMNELRALLAPSHVYPFYQVAVHEIVCGSMPPRMAGAAFFQVLLGLVCLPALLYMAGCVTDGLIEERSALHGLHKFEALAQEALSDMEDAAKSAMHRLFD
mmetsp:Transcript_36549/g.104001  ORF Transcript_36549/g.104001 Transcript_36549/m.104001 type:complete len:494 (+) Transcript_36549:64-1545(+)